MAPGSKLRDQARFATPESAARRIAVWHGEKREPSAVQRHEAPSVQEKATPLADLLFVSRELDNTKAMFLATHSVENAPQNQSFSVASALKKVVSQAVVATGMKPSRVELQNKMQLDEARIGALIFGDVPAGRHREFYQADAVTWAWNETQYGQKGQPQTMHVRYHLAPDTVYKTVNDGEPVAIKEQELSNFATAIQEHARRMKSHLSSL